MIARLIDWSSRRPWTILGAALLLALAAEAVRRSAPADVLPELSDPRIGVVVEWMGHPAAEVSEKVTGPVLRALSPLPGASAVRGASMLAEISRSPGAVVARLPLLLVALLPVAPTAASSGLVCSTPVYSRMRTSA